jgi:hypothetical protein
MVVISSEARYLLCLYFYIGEVYKSPLLTTPERRRFLLTTFVEMTGCVIPKPKARNLLCFRGVLRGVVAPSKWLSYRAKRDISSVYIGGSKSPPSNYPKRRRFLLTTFVEMTIIGRGHIPL